MTSGALARVIRSAADRRPDAEFCDLCGAEAPSGHRHLWDTVEEAVLCACRPCSLLFVEEGASEARYRLVPRRRVRLPPVDTQGLGVPVGLAFFVRHADDTVSAHLPSPAGAARWEADPAAWHDVVSGCPPLATIASEVEALLVNTAHSAKEYWIAPVDDCFRVVAIVRREWRGLSGGSRVWPAVEQFFAELTEQPQ
ncbi:DUF5947 family protein [Streptomyces glomeratus]|uniref:DUF5947 family protein n=1 Tax=Streptomyces glomeratus TaxID=284452 RepID=A0ABP6LD54_9ACTN|nr:DUF5947 family protein [Streptomyces glomeratus]MCF1508779.1 DUF5947 family protein [Streptomyces glomeratus]